MQGAADFLLDMYKYRAVLSTVFVRFMTKFTLCSKQRHQLLLTHERYSDIIILVA